MKYCSGCNQKLFLSSFHRAVRGRLGVAHKCKQCKSVYAKKRYQENRVTILEQHRDYYQQNKLHIRKAQQQYRIRTRDQRRHRRAADRALHRALHRARLLSATPSWLSVDEKKLIRALYARRKNDEHVDHIVPLKGDGVCGLHVHWNLQILPAFENLSKGNKL